MYKDKRQGIEKSKEWQKANRDKWNEYHRRWQRDNADKYSMIKKRWYELNKVRLSQDTKLILQHRCRSKASGLKIEKVCRLCGSKTEVDLHHPDYSKPLEVIPLCKVCHSKTYKAGRPTSPIQIAP